MQEKTGIKVVKLISLNEARRSIRSNSLKLRISSESVFDNQLEAEFEDSTEKNIKKLNLNIKIMNSPIKIYHSSYQNNMQLINKAKAVNDSLKFSKNLKFERKAFMLNANKRYLSSNINNKILNDGF